MSENRCDGCDKPIHPNLGAFCDECAADRLDLTPGSADWLRVVTASKVAAILGLSPWQSPYSLWQQMKGNLPGTAETTTTRRGHYLEPAILSWWCDQHGVTGYQEQVTYNLGRWAAATPDALANVDGFEVLVEAKSTAQEWDELPPYYLTQVIWQMHVSGIHRCYVPVIGPRLVFTEYVVDYADFADDAKVIEQRAREFYDSLAADVAPDLDSSVATYEAVRKVHPEIERGLAVELDRDTACALVEHKADHDALTDRLRLAKSTVLERMGRAQYAEHQGVRIARRQPRGDDVSFVITGKPHDLNRPEGDAA